MKILVIEDDPRVGNFLDRALRAEGHGVHVAADGLAGLRAARAVALDESTEPDRTVVILDLMLPGMDGLEICRTLRAEGATFPILMLSGMSAVEDRIAGLRAGADDYMGKPFDFEELLARLESLARRARGPLTAPPSRLTVADLVFDRVARRATRRGRVMNLTPKELRLLELMMSSPGRLFSRERLLSSVWGTTDAPMANVVDVYIRRLRAKLGEASDHPLIHTVRGLGYRLEEGPDDPHAIDRPSSS